MIVLGRHLSVLWLVLLALSTFRITRFVTIDDYPLWAPLRRKITDRWPPNPGAWSELVVCPHCFGVWAAAGVFVWWLLSAVTLGPVAVILSIAAVVSIAAETAG